MLRSLIICSQVVFLHPVHNFSLVAYDPSALGAGASVVRAAELLPGRFSKVNCAARFMSSSL